MTWRRVEEAMKELVWEESESLVVRLAERYSFDASEALKWLGQEPSRKGEKSSGKKVGERIIPSIPLPFCGVVNKEWCRGVRLNHGLHTQCTQPPGASELCKTCAGQAAKSGTGSPTYGRIEARVQHVAEGSEYNTWRDPSGKLVTPYSKIMMKLGISREDAEAEAERLGWTIPEQHFVVTERSAGRPKKSTATSDTESENGEAAPSGTAKRRGRPRKERVVESASASTGDDLIAQLLANAQQAATEPDEEKAVALPDVEESIATMTVDEDVVDPDKCRLTALYTKYAPEKVSNIDDILAKRPPGSAARTRMWHTLEGKYPGFFLKAPVVETENQDSESDEDVAVSEFVWKGRTYLRAADNVLYDTETQEEVGVWRESEQRIEELPASDFD